MTKKDTFAMNGLKKGYFLNSLFAPLFKHLVRIMMIMHYDVSKEYSTFHACEKNKIKMAHF